MRPVGRDRASAVMLAVVVPALLLLAACGNGSDSAATGGTATTDASTDSTTTPTSVVVPTTAQLTTTPAATGTPTTTATPGPDTAGWLAVDSFAGHDFEVAAVDDAVASARTVLGPPISDEVNAECGAGPVRTITWDGLHLLSLDGRIDGSFYRGTDPALTTPSGATVGTTLAELQGLFPTGEMTTDILGPEFFLSIDTASGPRFLGALLTDEQPAATVTSLYAGLTCFFR
jgi:hypothetical protein